MEQSAITEELRARIGVETPPHTFVVEQGAVRRFLKATGDTNPLYADEAWAKKTPYGGTIVPPTLFCPDAIITSMEIGLVRPRPFPTNIDGGTEWEIFAPVRVGDTLTLRAKVADMYEKQGSAKTGRMVFSIIEISCHNEKGTLVAIARGTSMSYEGPKGQAGAGGSA
ncbi:MAG: FAS1-like dehydratase domain-containing protein [Chloroflexota bacterium]